ncbi:MAG: nucleotidyl transferase AbiEii/AbiGii toxin family protein [Cyclobacteriaceae bacterium]
MMRVEELLKYYPENQRRFRDFILREYLQHKILQIIFEQPEISRQLCFLGGTCLRIVHGNTRFSEDIDFDNQGLDADGFELVADAIRKQLAREGYEVEIKTVLRSAFHCYIRFPGILFQEGLSGHAEQKILIQLDTEPQHYSFAPEKVIVNKFDVFTEIPVTPLSILLAQKFFTIVNRKRAKGRDFFDVVFLLGKNIKPDYKYLNLKLNVNNSQELKELVLQTCTKLNMHEMALDVAPFLFNASDAKKVELFEKYLKQVEL